jgi:hypothetical protein
MHKSFRLRQHPSEITPTNSIIILTHDSSSSTINHQQKLHHQSSVIINHQHKVLHTTTTLAISTVSQPPSPSPVAPNAAAAASAANKALTKEALGAVTNVARFNAPCVHTGPDLSQHHHLQNKTSGRRPWNQTPGRILCQITGSFSANMLAHSSGSGKMLPLFQTEGKRLKKKGKVTSRVNKTKAAMHFRPMDLPAVCCIRSAAILLLTMNKKLREKIY